jgi:hypothetical protein
MKRNSADTDKSCDCIKKFLSDKSLFEGETGRIVISRAPDKKNVCFFITTREHPELCGGHIGFYNSVDNSRGIEIGELMEVFDFLCKECGYDVVVDMDWMESKVNQS